LHGLTAAEQRIKKFLAWGRLQGRWRSASLGGLGLPNDLLSPRTRGGRTSGRGHLRFRGAVAIQPPPRLFGNILPRQRFAWAFRCAPFLNFLRNRSDDDHDKYDRAKQSFHGDTS
jgi:hypothetical protein